MKFDIKNIPFSAYGSYLAFSHLNSDETEGGLYFRSVHGGYQKNGAIFKLELTYKGNSVPFKEIATQTLLRLELDQGAAEI